MAKIKTQSNRIKAETKASSAINHGDEEIFIKGARVHNLKNINVKIPKFKFVVLTGVSGSGKSSLAFDTLYAEGQRRYVESLSSYARQFLELMEKPDVDLITGLSPAISIDQKTAGRNPRSTVGTITEINDYMRLLYARIGIPHCPKCGKPVKAQSVQQITDSILQRLEKTGEAKVQVLSPIVKGRKGEYSDLFDSLLSKGFIRVRVDGDTRNLEEDIKLKKFQKHTIEIIVDRLTYSKTSNQEKKEDTKKRLTDSLEVALNNAEGEALIIINDREFFYSENNSCPVCDISFPKLEPHSFSFNSPHGACPNCSGLGEIKRVAIELVYNPNLSITEGGIFPWSNKTTTDSWTLRKLEAVSKKHRFNLRTPIGELPQEIFDLIFYGKGSKPPYAIEYVNRFGKKQVYETEYEGVIPEIERRYSETNSEYARNEYEKYMRDILCEECEGKRLRPTSLAVTVGKKNISETQDMTIKDLQEWIKKLDLSSQKKVIAKPILKEISLRLSFLQNVGLEYLNLSRKANTLSGGEAQRIRLASQIGTGLTGVLYVLDEPSIGLHDRDMGRLLDTLTGLRELGNTVIVVEHDEETMRTADWIIDMGPGAGEHGGKIVSEGTPKQIEKDPKSLTGKYLSGKLEVHRPDRRESKSINKFTIIGAKEHNLKKITAEFPLGKMISVTGVSGSGKSTLVNDTLYKILVNELQNGKQIPGKHDSFEGIENITKVINIDQSPIGRTPRSNPATYTGLFTPIRELFSQTQEARARGYKPGRFSFNVKGGRCETCKGDGAIKIEMQFLPDMYVKCEECDGKRYNREVLQVDFKGKNISDVLDMTVTEAQDFFSSFGRVKRRLDTLVDVGLGYIRLGQPATTLSGGEAQRIKLATELSKVPRGHTVYLLDEPTTGLHFHDVDKLIQVLHRLVDQGHTVILIEHNLDVIKSSDWIIDLGPEGGEKGGEIVAQGTVEDLIKVKRSHTGQSLKKHLK
ncbi:excinuclease ABC subunit UvrA [Candidatus Dojkabacteria bacterium]|nr:excinuclease ABC subunit UvrA [Candidatus Dojkabacteria bacterium]